MGIEIDETKATADEFTTRIYSSYVQNNRAGKIVAVHTLNPRKK